MKRATRYLRAITFIVLTLVFSAMLLFAARSAHAQTEVVLYNFCSQPNCADGESPSSSLAPDGAGNFYGTTQLGGANMYGTVLSFRQTGPAATTRRSCTAFVPCRTAQMAMAQLRTWFSMAPEISTAQSAPVALTDKASLQHAAMVQTDMASCSS